MRWSGTEGPPHRPGSHSSPGRWVSGAEVGTVSNSGCFRALVRISWQLGGLREEEEVAGIEEETQREELWLQ